jgi:hypothetical protein
MWATALLQSCFPEYWKHVTVGAKIDAYEGSRLIGMATVDEVG